MAHLITDLILKGTVVAVASNAMHEFSKRAKESIKLIEDHGVEGDAHAGRFMQHRYLAKQMPALLNNRQVHLMASELFADLTSSGFTVAPGELGENVTTAGLSLTNFPLGRACGWDAPRLSSSRAFEHPAHLLIAFRTD